MASVNNTQIIITSADSGPTTGFRRTPAPDNPESFYFNHDPISAVIHADDGRRYKLENASVHLTDKRLVLLVQPNLYSASRRHSYHESSSVFSFQVDLFNLASLKWESPKSKAMQLRITTCQQETYIVQLKFSKADRARQNAFKEYLEMITSASVSRRRSVASLNSAAPWLQDELPSYGEALRQAPAFQSQHLSPSLAATHPPPPAYSC
ncbi:uncharacterized protein BYT42DRAFT_571146 [Radiomyces spectabilis]|uniref:uncharacterized protein n=1 Tax=Radiomyces spectabilis TaxID=64574 RepID=UPI00221FBD25|nr:uncharacterized protein BYT42DRAFT_571146 [Radiomyces spectabilis]KAI8377662.1 hypothetical protein BYT42DRAFT_571146 [Radiomyces spectabilis]